MQFHCEHGIPYLFSQAALLPAVEKRRVIISKNFSFMCILSGDQSGKSQPALFAPGTIRIFVFMHHFFDLFPNAVMFFREKVSIFSGFSNFILFLKFQQLCGLCNGITAVPAGKNAVIPYFEKPFGKNMKQEATYKLINVQFHFPE
jgi:hypothetical protein